MDFSDFRSRAIAEGKRYGKDEYVFVREFAQNARDAGARRISLSAGYQDGKLQVVFTDDGAGMAFAHARRYLFTLYASSKEKESASAGQFGVGFWSILLFSPQSILIYSRSQKENWGVEFNQTLDRERPTQSPLQHQGTQVVAFKSLDEHKALEVISDLEASLKRYCRYLRRNDRAASPLAVIFNGRRIDGPMVLEGECAATFSYRDVQGAVALGKSPQVTLHVRGLPVWSGTSLSELQYGASPEVPISYPSGLAPVFLLNGNRLSVTLDRRSVFDDAALQKTRRIASREMRRLVSRYLDNIAPPGILARLEYFFSTFVEDFSYHFSRRILPLLPILAVILIAGAGIFYFFPEQIKSVVDSKGSDHTFELPFLPAYQGGASFSNEYDHATTDSLSGDTLQMQYAPADKLLYFRTQVVEQLDIHNGAHSGRLTPYRVPANYTCQTDCIDVSFWLDNGPGVYHLPVPSGHYIDHSSVTFSRDVDGELVRSSKDDWLYILKNLTSGRTPVITYRTGPVTTSLSEPERYLETPDIRLPDAYKMALRKADNSLLFEQKITFLTALVEQSIQYDTSTDTVTRYRSFFNESPPGNWYDFVFMLNRGDCDVKNIILINLLRRLKIPSRLAIGYVGKDGRTEPGKHAWVEYYQNGWRIADATGQAAVEAESATDADMATAADTDAGAREPVPAPAPAAVPAPAESTESLPQLHIKTPSTEELAPVLMWSGIAICMFVIGLVVLIFRKVFSVTHSSPSAEQETLAARMLQAALENDKMNIRGSGLFSRALIPAYGDRRISMNQAIRLARRGILFYSAERNELVDELVKRKRVVVKTENSVFAPVIGRLPGGLNLVEVATLRPVQLSLETISQGAGHDVLHEVFRICDRIGISRDFIVPCLGLSGMLFREFDLSALPFGWKSNIPHRFIAVKLEDEQTWQSLISLGNGVEGAAILTLDRIAAHSDLLFELRDEIRTALAQSGNTHSMKEQ